MAESDFTKVGYELRIDGKYYNALDIESFSLMMKDPSYCYKFYWLEAIVRLISEGVTETTFDAIIDEMICNAWYSVREFHIHLSGVQADGLERAYFDKMLDLKYENECLKRENQELKAENWTLKAKLEKVYDFMRQFTINGMNMLEHFLRSIGEWVQQKVAGMSGRKSKQMGRGAKAPFLRL